MNPQDAAPISTETLAERFQAALDRLENARSFARPNYRNQLLELVVRLLRRPDGLPVLYEPAARYEAAGVFQGGDWEFPATLQPNFVANSLDARGWMLAIEILSEMRFLAIAQGKTTHPDVTPEHAREFLEQALALNSFRLFPESNECTRGAPPEIMQGLQRFVLFMAEHLGSEGILESILREADRVLAQRPIMVQRVRSLIRAAERIAQAHGFELNPRGRLLIAAMEGASPLAAEHRDPNDYLQALQTATRTQIEQEAAALGNAMWATGLTCPQHAILLRHIVGAHPVLLPSVLGLEQVGTASLSIYQPLVRRLIETAIIPPTAQSIYGLACMLAGGILFFPPVSTGLRRLMRVDIHPKSAEQLLSGWDQQAPPRDVLLAGTISILGQPLGLGQGNNPTCQSARALSLWAQNDTGFLLEIITQAARDGDLVMHFEGEPLHSGTLQEGLLTELQGSLDPVSMLLVPHLDRIYAEMGRRVADRGEDGHRWINPEMHGWWNYRGFASAIEYATGAIRDLESFLRLFYACYHPDYRNGHLLTYPQPAGVAVTNLWGAFVGWHAVTIQRTEIDPSGLPRVYFYNPNSDRGQRWGPDIQTSTSGNGEFAGESSLPFEQFAARVYVFHYDMREHGDPTAVPADEIARVIEAVRLSWGLQKVWV